MSNLKVSFLLCLGALTGICAARMFFGLSMSVYLTTTKPCSLSVASRRRVSSDQCHCVNESLLVYPSSRTAAPELSRDLAAFFMGAEMLRRSPAKGSPVSIAHLDTSLHISYRSRSCGRRKLVGHLLPESTLPVSVWWVELSSLPPSLMIPFLSHIKRSPAYATRSLWMTSRVVVVPSPCRAGLRAEMLCSTIARQPSGPRAAANSGEEQASLKPVYKLVGFICPKRRSKIISTTEAISRSILRRRVRGYYSILSRIEELWSGTDFLVDTNAECAQPKA